MLTLYVYRVKEFLANSTQNVLAFGPNVTTRSDFRIFTADGGDTIRKMAASSDDFMSTCQGLLERMLNTVPSGVKQTDIIKPIRIKPTLLETNLMPETKTMTIWGSVRVSTLAENFHQPFVELLREVDTSSFSDPRRRDHEPEQSRHGPPQAARRDRLPERRESLRIVTDNQECRRLWQLEAAGRPPIHHVLVQLYYPDGARRVLARLRT